MNIKKVKLKRTLSLFQISFYGIGTILGAGIYALIGKIAAVSGTWAPLSFFVSAVLISFTAYSYCQLVKMHPKSAGEAEYVYQGFNSVFLSNVVAWLVAFSGLVSAAALTRGFVGYLQQFFPLSDAVIQVGLITTITIIAIIGIRESAWLAVAMTFIEVIGLLLICFKGLPYVYTEGITQFDINSLTDMSSVGPILAGGFLAIYAFIGFEDMVNLAEEVKQPERNIPLAIIFSLIVCTALYILVGVVTVSSLPLSELSNSGSPLSDAFEKAGGNPNIISAIGLFAIFNGLLAQIIMVSRILYGARHTIEFFKKLSAVNIKTKTPIISTLVISISILVFSLLYPIETLAGATSYLILLVFTLINGSLILLNKRSKSPTALNYSLPFIGIILNISLMIYNLL